ncbi:MAG: gliding motility protein GldN [Paludibacteraceae bacterium]|nr:gliding motility protein GldN [Paludibacteraceae bacterium]
MKKISVLVLFVFAVIAANAQHTINSFFAPDGTVRLETQELNEAADSIVTIKHRSEDIVWRRDIYRIVDMRQKQNFQLYFPVEPDDPTYVSLYRLIVDAIQNPRKSINQTTREEFYDTLHIFYPSERVLKPLLSIDNIVPRNKIIDQFVVGGIGELDREDETSYILNYDSVSDQLNFQPYNYQTYVRNQLKYLVYEVIFFSRATSRMYRKIVAIAPLQPDQATGGPEEPGRFMRESVKFWMLYDELRPYLASHYMIPTQNEAKRVTFEEFFEKRLFSSYIIGEGNMYNRMILDYCFTEETAKQEQARIEYELLTFEQDLWEY